MEDTESSGSTNEPKLFKWTLDDNGTYNCDTDFKDKQSAAVYTFLHQVYYKV